MKKTFLTLFQLGVVLMLLIPEPESLRKRSVRSNPWTVASINSNPNNCSTP